MKFVQFSLVAFLFLFAFSANAEERQGVPDRVMFVKGSPLPNLWIYIDPADNKNCASDGIIKIQNSDYNEGVIKIWSSAALSAFTAKKTLRVWYSDAQISNDNCLITNLSVMN